MNDVYQNLYRFRPINDYTLDELEKSYLYFASPEQLNDPMEGFYNLIFKGDKNKWKQLFKHFLMTMYLVELHSILQQENYEQNQHIFDKDIVYKMFECRIADHIDFDRIVTEKLSDIINDIQNKPITEHQLKNILDSIWNASFKFYLQRLYKDNNLEITEDCFQNSKVFYYQVNNGECLHSNRINDYIKHIKQFTIKEGLFCCFSLDYKNPAMWSHYADNHKGICIEFAKIVAGKIYNTPIEFFPKQVKYTNNKFKQLEFFSSIEYNSNYTPLKKFFLIEDNQEQKEEKYLEYGKEVDEIYHTKFKEWEYEKEYRLTLPRDCIQEQKISVEQQSIVSVTFGINTSTEQKDKIIKIIRDKNIQFFAMYNCNGKFDRIKISFDKF